MNDVKLNARKWKHQEGGILSKDRLIQKIKKVLNFQHFRPTSKFEKD